MAKEVSGDLQTWALGGYGLIGKEVVRQLAKPEVADRLGLTSAPAFILRKAGVMGPDGETKNADSITEIEELPDNFFMVLPSTDDGQVAYEITSYLLDNGKRVITAEKGALANNFLELKLRSSNFRRLGIDATVGGGTHLLRAAEMLCRDHDNISEIHLALNGTLNALFSTIAPPGLAGKTLGQAVYEAGKLGFADPPQDDMSQTPYDVIRGEAAKDVPKKVAIFFNYLGFSEIPIDWRELIRDLSDEEIDQAIEDASNRRFIVSIYPEQFQGKSKKGPEGGIIGEMSYSYEGWRLVSGFRKLKSNPLFFPLGTLTGAKNGAVIAVGPDESDGDYWPGIGPGAGPAPTVNSMLDNYVDLRRQQQVLDDYVNEVLEKEKATA